MSVEYRPRDPIPPGDDVVLRAGSGAVDILVQRAIVNAPDYEQLLRDGHVRSIFTMSVHVPRGDLPTTEDLLADPFYLRYRAYLEAPSAGLVDLAFVEIVATTPVTAGGMPSALDLCHYDIVIEADGEQQLRERIEIVVWGSPAMRVDLLDDDRVGKDTGSMKTFSVDLTRLPSSGHGTVRI